MLIALAAAILAAAVLGGPRADRIGLPSDYAGIVEGMRHGGNYYEVAGDGLRAENAAPDASANVRLPALAAVAARVPEWLLVLALYALSAGTMFAWYVRLEAAVRPGPPRAATMLLLVSGAVAFAAPAAVAVPEVWAGLLVVLSLALHRPGRWIETVALALAAMLIRETAALYALVMAAFALQAGDRRQLGGWTVALVVLALVFAAHVHAVAAIDFPAAESAAASTEGGFAAVIGSRTGLAIFPGVVASGLATLALLGWSAWRDPLGARALAVFAAYAVAITAGLLDAESALLVALPLAAGLVFVPDAARDLVRAALDRRRITVTRVVR